MSNRRSRKPKPQRPPKPEREPAAKVKVVRVGTRLAIEQRGRYERWV